MFMCQKLKTYLHVKTQNQRLKTFAWLNLNIISNFVENGEWNYNQNTGDEWGRTGGFHGKILSLFLRI